MGQYTILYIIFTVVTIYYIIEKNTFSLPDPTPDLNDNKYLFSEVRAMSYLRYLESTGVNVLGSYANEVVIPQYLTDCYTDIKRISEINRTFITDFERQNVSGVFDFDFLDLYTNAYFDVTNIVISVVHRQLMSQYNSSRLIPSLLISAHFDSAVVSKGASDDLVAISSMIEIIHNIIYSDRYIPLKLIFLFNGAEETFMKGSHGYMVNNNENLIGFLNMESMGSGGPPILFESTDGPNWIADVYLKYVKSPLCNNGLQELFDFNVFPARTDYSIYKNFSNTHLSGIDLAYIKNGYIYHTIYDDINHVEKGQIQSLGNVMSDILFNLPNITDIHHIIGSNRLIFDVWRFNTAEVSFVWGVHIYFILFFLQFYIFYLKTTASFRIVLVFLFSFLFSILISNAINTVMIFIFGGGLLWFSSPVYILLLYVPLIIFSIKLSIQISSFLFRIDPHSMKKHIYLCLSITTTMLMVVLIVIRSRTFILFLPYQLLTMVISLINIYKFKYKKFIIFILITFNLAIYLPALILNNYIFAPILGRIGLIPVYLLEFAIITLLCLYGYIVIYPYVVFIMEKKQVTFNSLWISLYIIMFSYLYTQNQFTIDTPKRLFLIHEHHWNNNDSNNQISLPKSHLMISIADPLNDESLLPFQLSDWFKLPFPSNELQNIHIPFHLMMNGHKYNDIPIYHDFLPYKPLITFTIVEDTHNYTVVDNYISFYESGRATITVDTESLISWSLSESIPRHNDNNKGRYYIRFDGGLHALHLNYTLKLTKPYYVKTQISICYTSSQLFKLNYKMSDSINDYIEKLPNWIAPSQLLCGITYQDNYS